jgi:hypothetical protein
VDRWEQCAGLCCGISIDGEISRQAVQSAFLCYLLTCVALCINPLFSDGTEMERRGVKFGESWTSWINANLKKKITLHHRVFLNWYLW